MEDKINIIFFTDPICSTCWGIEPHINKFRLEYGHLIDVDYRMGGLLPYWEKYSSVTVNNPSDVKKHWDEKSDEYEMPIDGDLWSEDPLDSSYPPSIAFKAVEIQDKEKAIKYLRRLREMVFTEKRNITKWEYLSKAATEFGIDLKQFKKDYNGIAKELFHQDLQLAKQNSIKIFPTLIMKNSLGDVKKIKGYNPYNIYEDELMKIYFKTKKRYYNKEGLDIFNIYPTLTTKEFAELKGVNYKEAELLLHKYENKNKIKSYKVKNGSIWTKNKLTIIGGGIAGLALANFLEQKEQDYQIFEKNLKLSKRGHGFIIPPKGIEILSEIFPVTDFFNCGNKLEFYSAYDHLGKMITKINMDSTFVISRNSLIDLLLKAIPGHKIQYGKEFKELHLKDSLVNEIVFNGIGKSKVNPEIVVAADGVNSKIRRKLFPENKLNPVPENEIVSIIKDEELAESLGAHFNKYIFRGGGLAVGLMRLNREEIIWFVQFDTEKYNPALDTPTQKRNFIYDHFSNWCDPIPHLIETTNFNHSHLWRVHELNDFKLTNKNNTLLLGDAAQPLIPLTSKGVTQALKDAKLFSDLLDVNSLEQKADIDYLFKQYHEIRQKETENNNKTGSEMLRNFKLPLEKQSEPDIPISLD